MEETSRSSSSRTPVASVTDDSSFLLKTRIAAMFLVGFVLGILSILCLYGKEFTSVGSMRPDMLSTTLAKPEELVFEMKNGTAIAKQYIQSTNLVDTKTETLLKEGGIKAVNTPTTSNFRGTFNTTAAKKIHDEAMLKHKMEIDEKFKLIHFNHTKDGVHEDVLDFSHGAESSWLKARNATRTHVIAAPEVSHLKSKDAVLPKSTVAIVTEDDDDEEEEKKRIEADKQKLLKKKANDKSKNRNSKGTSSKKGGSKKSDEDEDEDKDDADDEEDKISRTSNRLIDMIDKKTKSVGTTSSGTSSTSSIKK